MTHKIKIKVTVVARTDLGLLVNDGRREAWVPLSQVVEEIEEPTGPLNIMATVAIVVHDWLAKEKGLEPTVEDDQTLDIFGAAP